MPYQPDQVMLNRLREQMSVDLNSVKAELRQSINSIYGVFRKRSIHNQIKDIEKILADKPSKISYQKRVLRQLRSDYKIRQSWPSRLLNRVGIDRHVLPG
jgi:flagellar biosynthesis regulator FlbT